MIGLYKQRCRSAKAKETLEDAIAVPRDELPEICMRLFVSPAGCGHTDAMAWVECAKSQKLAVTSSSVVSSENYIATQCVISSGRHHPRRHAPAVPMIMNGALTQRRYVFAGRRKRTPTLPGVRTSVCQYSTRVRNVPGIFAISSFNAMVCFSSAAMSMTT